MTCKEFEKEISTIFLGKTDIYTQMAFMEHYKKCPLCREELSIQYLVQKGIQRLEQGEGFDLSKEKDMELNNLTKQISRFVAKKQFIVSFYSMLFLAIIIVLALILF